jgi:hypothetical protein
VGAPIAAAVRHFLGEAAFERARPLTVKEAARWSL